MKYWNVIINSAWIAATAAIVLTGLGMIFMPELRQYHQNNKTIATLASDINQENKTYHEYKKKQERFRTEPEYVEQIAHEQGLVYPHEKIFNYEGDKNQTTIKDRIN